VADVVHEAIKVAVPARVEGRGEIAASKHEPQ
jgi:hypothetical protein